MGMILDSGDVIFLTYVYRGKTLFKISLSFARSAVKVVGCAVSVMDL